MTDEQQQYRDLVELAFRDPLILQLHGFYMGSSGEHLDTDSESDPDLLLACVIQQGAEARGLPSDLDQIVAALRERRGSRSGV